MDRVLDRWSTNGCLTEQVIVGVLRAMDLIIVLSTALLAHLTRSGSLEDFHGSQVYAIILSMFLVANAFQYADLYGPGPLETRLCRVDRLFAAWLFVLLCLVSLGFATKSAHEMSRLWVGFWFIYGFAGLCIVRLVLRYQIQSWQRCGRLKRKLVLVGAGEHGRRLIEYLDRADRSPVRIVGVFDELRTGGPASVGQHRVLHFDDLPNFVRDRAVDEVLVALPGSAEKEMLTIINCLRDLPVDVRVYPDLIGLHLICRNVSYLNGVPLLHVFERPLKGWNYVAKAVEDRLLAALALLIVAPLMLIIALAIRFDSPGPVIFRQKRYGFNNRMIEVFKFRTMHDGAAETGLGAVAQARRGDPRLTRIGRFLRRSSLDELPQLINVLRGEMSLVGPRPHAVTHNLEYAQLIDAYTSRHRVKPGMTGWAQINGLRGEIDTIDKMERRIRHDLYYIENWSLAFDLRILIRTPLAVLGHENAY